MEYNQGMPWQGKPGGAAKLGEYVNSARPYVASLMARGGSFLTPFTAMSPMKMLEATTPSIQRAALGPPAPEATPNARVADAFSAVPPAPMWNSSATTLANPTMGKFAPMLPAEPQAPTAAPAAAGPAVEDQGLIQKFLGMIYDKGSRGFESAPEGPRLGPFAR